MNSPLARFVRLVMVALVLVTASVQPAGAQSDAGPSVLRDTETELLFKQMSLPLIQAAGLDPRSVNVVLLNDSEINAFVATGQTVYIQSGLLEATDNVDQLQGVVAHELGHVHYHDVPRGLLYLAIVAPFGMLAVARLSERMAPRGAGPVAAIPAVALSIALIAPAITTISNQLSRDVEARADRFSMQLTRNPDELIAFQRRITTQNVGDPDPPGWSTFLLATHPTPMQRIGQALAFKQGDRAGGPRGGS